MTILGPDNQPMALDEIPSVLRALRDATGTALQKMQTTYPAFCYQAEHFETDSGPCGWRVYLHSRLPDGMTLRLELPKLLAERGWPGVEVVTEW